MTAPLADRIRAVLALAAKDLRIIETPYPHGHDPIWQMAALLRECLAMVDSHTELRKVLNEVWEKFDLPMDDPLAWSAAIAIVKADKLMPAARVDL